MGESNGDWLRVRGIGRERFATYLAEYLGTIGYTVERTEGSEPTESRVKGRLDRMNPALPPAASALEFRLYPTSGGAALVWQVPTEVPADERQRIGPAGTGDLEPSRTRNRHREPRDREGRSAGGVSASLGRLREERRGLTPAFRRQLYN